MIPENKLIELKKLRKDIQDCDSCRMRSFYNKPVGYAGSPIAEIMFIGEAPGADEVKEGKPFVGKSGKTLKDAIINAGIDLENVFIANVICCRPPNNVFPDDEIVVNACRHWLEKAFLFLKPKILIAVGGKAHKYFMNSNTGITQVCGQWSNESLDINGETYRFVYLPTLHPSFCLRGEMKNSPNKIMQLNSQDKQQLLQSHIASIPSKLKEVKNGNI